MGIHIGLFSEEEDQVPVQLLVTLEGPLLLLIDELAVLDGIAVGDQPGLGLGDDLVDGVRTPVRGHSVEDGEAHAGSAVDRSAQSIQHIVAVVRIDHHAGALLLGESSLDGIPPRLRLNRGMEMTEVVSGFDDDVSRQHVNGPFL